MPFDEARNRTSKDHGPQNLAVLRREKRVNLEAKNKRLKARRKRDYHPGILLSPVLAKKTWPCRPGR
jgi:hypothetical protein